MLVICRDRLDPLLDLLAWLEAEGMTDIHLIDNDSTNPALLDFFATDALHRGSAGPQCRPHQPLAAGASRTCAGPFVVSDCEVVPDADATGAVATSSTY